MTRSRLAQRWESHGKQWREPAQVIGAWWDGSPFQPDLLAHRVHGPWWSLLEELGITLLVTREYEHLVIAMHARNNQGLLSCMPLPHPSGLAVDRRRGRVMIASTRNPNQVVELRPLASRLARRDITPVPDPANPRPLLPTRTWFYPGSLYIHDLALIGPTLHANAVGHNAVVRLADNGAYERVWWPRSIDGKARPHVDRNYLQLNSIAAGATLSDSFFSASAEKRGRLRPGDPDFAVDRRGVIFSGRTREPVCHGLTRPHSARLHRRRLWVDNSGYGELGFVCQGALEPVVRLPGWTRGLCFHRHIAFVGTSQVLPRFHRYAPGLDPRKCMCALHAVDTVRGTVLASLQFTSGNQLFAIDWLPSSVASGLPFTLANARHADLHTSLFYAGDPGLLQES